MTRRFRAVLLVGLLALFLAGCAGNPEDKVAGHYTGKITLSKAAEDQAKKSGAMGAQFLSALAQMKMELDLNKDKSFTMKTSAAGNSGSISGTWELTDKQISLNTTSQTVNGKPSTQQAPAQKFTVDDTFTTLTADAGSNQAAAQMGSLVFTKAG